MIRFFVVCVVLSATSLAYGQSNKNLPNRISAAKRALSMTETEFTAGSATPEQVYTWSVRVMIAQIEVQPSQTSRWLREHRDRMHALLTEVRSMVAASVATQTWEAACTYFVSEAEYWITRGYGPNRSSP